MRGKGTRSSLLSSVLSLGSAGVSSSMKKVHWRSRVMSETSLPTSTGTLMETVRSNDSSWVK